MSDTPSWLTEDTVEAGLKAAKNPVVQKVALKTASNPVVQAAVKDAAIKSVTGSESATSEPGWAKTTPNATAVKSGDIESGQSSSSASTSEFEVDEETLRQMRTYHTALRILYMTSAILLGTAGGLFLARYQQTVTSTETGGNQEAANALNQQDIGLTFFACYVMLFALMICIFETGLSACARVVAINFGFMYNIAGRMIFMLYVGFMAFGLGPTGIAAMCWLYVIGIFHVFVACKFPKFQEYTRRKDFFAETGGKR